MEKFLKGAGLLSLVLIFSVVYGQDSLDRYLSKYRKLKTYQAKFEQRKHLSMMSQDQVSKGYIKFKKQDKVIWALEKPYVYRLILNNKRIVKEYPQLNEREEFNIDEDPQMKAIFDNIYLFMGLKNKSDIEMSYLITVKKDMLTLVPKSVTFKKYLSRIDLQFSSDYLVRSILLTEPSGDYTLIKFSDFQLDKSIADTEFKVN